MLLIECMAIGQTQCISRPRCLRGPNRAEANDRRRTGPELHDLIVEPLPLVGIAATLLDHAMQPLANVGRGGPTVAAHPRRHGLTVTPVRYASPPAGALVRRVTAPAQLRRRTPVRR